MVTKEKLVRLVHANTDLTLVEIDILVEFIFDIIKETLATGETVRIHQLGNFVVKANREKRKHVHYQPHRTITGGGTL